MNHANVVVAASDKKYSGYRNTKRKKELRKGKKK